MVGMVDMVFMVGMGTLLMAMAEGIIGEDLIEEDIIEEEIGHQTTDLQTDPTDQADLIDRDLQTLSQDQADHQPGGLQRCRHDP